MGGHTRGSRTLLDLVGRNLARDPPAAGLGELVNRPVLIVVGDEAGLPECEQVFTNRRSRVIDVSSEDSGTQHQLSIAFVKEELEYRSIDRRHPRGEIGAHRTPILASIDRGYSRGLTDRSQYLTDNLVGRFMLPPTILLV